jgi:hypothetical protein
MSQLGLPFDDDLGPRRTSSAAEKGKGLASADDCTSSEERALQVEIVESAGSPAKLIRQRAPTASASPSQSWGAGLTWDQALLYTALSPRQLRSWQNTGALKFRRVGRNGVRVALRRQLDDLMETVFAAPIDDIGEDFDFG